VTVINFFNEHVTGVKLENSIGNVVLAFLSFIENASEHKQKNAAHLLLETKNERNIIQNSTPAIWSCNEKWSWYAGRSEAFCALAPAGRQKPTK
jgi:hypothetical protein